MISLNIAEIYDNSGYLHVDLEARNFRNLLSSNMVKFKLFTSAEESGLEFRRDNGWPEMFEAAPWQIVDEYGPKFVINASREIKSVLEQFTVNDREFLIFLVSCLPGMIGVVTASHRFSPKLAQRITAAMTSVWEAFEAGGADLRNRSPVQANGFVMATDALAGSHENSAAEQQPTITVAPDQAPVPQQTQPPQPAASARPVIPAEPPEYVKTVLAEFETVQLETVAVSRHPIPDQTSPIVISVVKNELNRLHDFLRHYRESGIERFVFVDNDSKDGTLEYLASQPDCDVYTRHGAFNWMLKQGWINKVVALYGYHRWYMYFDADEHAVFDGLGEQTFQDLACHMEAAGLRRVRGLLVDMYAECPLIKSEYTKHARLDAAYPCFDTDSYKEMKYKEIVSVKGGPRTRVFGRTEPKFRPELTKYPLFKLTRDEFMVNPRHIWPYAENFVSARYLGVLHYKFLPNIIEKIRAAIRDKSYWDESYEYKCYLKAIEADENLCLKYEGSAIYRKPSDLVKAGVIEPIDWKKAAGGSELMRSAFRRHRSKLTSAQGMTAFMSRYENA